MAGCCHHHFLADAQFHIHAAGKESATGAKGQLGGYKRVLDRAIRRRFGLETASTRGRELSLGQTIDAVVQQQQVHVDVAAHLVDKVVATDSQTVTVARHLPNGHVGVSGLETGCHSATTSVNGVEGISLGIIRQTRAATDTRNHGRLLGGNTQLCHRLEQNVEHGMVSTTRAPTDGLIILVIQGLVSHLLVIGILFHYNSSSIMMFLTPSTIS